MTELKGFQKKYLKSLAHHLKPTVLVGQQGVTPALLLSIEEALHAHELIKIKFNDFKEKEVKDALMEEIVQKTGAHFADLIGHVLILFKPCKTTEKRKIKLPKTAAEVKKTE